MQKPFRLIGIWYVVFIFGFIVLVESSFAWPTINGKSVCGSGNDQKEVQLITDGSGGAIMVWSDMRNASTSTTDIYAQRIGNILNTSASPFLKETTLWKLNGVAICTAGNIQGFPKLVSDGQGGAIIVWQDQRSGSEYDIYAQRVNAQGTTLWSLNGVAICTAGFDQSPPQLIPDNQGGAIIVWEDFRTGGINSDVYAQRVNSVGSTLWVINGIAICTAASFQDTPKLDSDGQGGAIISWRDFRNGTANADIYAQRVNAVGSTLWTLDGIAISTSANAQEEPEVISDECGGAIITWQDYRSTTGNPGQGADIYAQRVNSIGSTLWTLTGVSVSTATSSQLYPKLSSDSQGGAIIVWQDYRSGSTADIYGQRIKSDGSILWNVNGNAISTASADQMLGSLVSDGQGGVIAVWYDYHNGPSDIYAQRVNPQGSVDWTTNGISVCNATNNQKSPVLIPDGQGGAIITWQDYRSGTNYDIYAQQIDFAGTTTTHYYWSGINGSVSVCTATGNQYFPQLISDGQGGAIIAWEDYRSGSNFDYYAQRVDMAGNILWTLNGVCIATTLNSTYGPPRLTPDGQGGAFITWYTYKGSGIGDIYAQRINASGSIAWPLNGVAICTASEYQQYPQLIPDGEGGAIITWQDRRSMNYNIYAQRINAVGTLQWTPLNGVPISTGGNNKENPQLVSDGQGGAIISWADNYNIYAQRVNAVGSILWTVNGMAICTTVNIQAYPQMISDGQGGAIISWQDYAGSSLPTFYAQRVDATGNILWASNGVGICTTRPAGWNPYYAQSFLVSDGQGGAIIAWDDIKNGNHVYAQRVNPTGTMVWALNGVAVCTVASYSQWSTQIVADGQGGAIITWQGTPGSNSDIYAQRIDASGNMVSSWPVNGFAICTAVNMQASPQLVSDGQGGAIITWYDYRNGTNNDIYAQRIYSSGWVGTPPNMVPVELSRFEAIDGIKK
jgi:hypothetical protein